MVIYLKAGGELRSKLNPDVDYYTRRVETEEEKCLEDILTGIGVTPGTIIFLF